MSIKILAFFILSFLFSLDNKGQSKFEKEYRIRSSEIHGSALNFMDSTGISEKIKWYREESQDGITVEAKFSYLEARHSVEFDTSGKVLDIEVEIPFGNLEKGQKQNITKALDSMFSKYKIRKIQAQWTGSRQDHLQRLRSGKSIDRNAPRYEIVVRGKKDGSRRYHEVLLEANGTVVSILPMVMRSADNLDF